MFHETGVRMTTFRFSGLHHAAFATSDMEKTIGYWRDLLGFKIVYGLKDSDQIQYAFQISKQTMVFFFEWKEVQAVKTKRHGEPVKGPFTFDHLAIHMVSQEDLAGLQDQLVCADFPVSDVIDHGFLHSIYTFDPNGIPLEFSWVVPGVDLDSKPVFGNLDQAEFQSPAQSPIPDKWPKCKEDPDDVRIILPGKEKKFFT
jgi:catechol 2,3-dioxygenase-like lactoylglutathione lyase family enzyme